MRLLPALTFFSVLGMHAAEKTHLDYRAEARAAYERKNYALARDAIESALELRPDSPRYLHNHAALCALMRDSDAAIGSLRRLAALGVVMPAERDPDLASLQGTQPFLEVLQRFAANREPLGEAEVLAELPGRTGIIEGIAFRPRTGDVFLSDVHHRCIWRRDRTGQLSRFTVEDEELFGIFGLALDESRNTLWAAMTALPEMEGFTAEMKGQAALAEFNLSTSELRRIVDIPSEGRDHGVGDLLVASDGTVYATDSRAPVIWRLAPGAEEVDKLVESPQFASLQGLALMERTLIVADYSNGLFAVDISTGSVAALEPPEQTTLLGIDGLTAIPGGIVAVQNGVEPQRVLRINLSPDFGKITGVTVLARALPHLNDLALVTLMNDQPALIAGAGWDGFDPEKAPHPQPHSVRIFQIALP